MAIVLKMASGYAYKLVRREWDTVIIGEAEADGGRFFGYRDIDGNKMAVFKYGRSYYAQLAHSVRRVDTVEEAARKAQERKKELAWKRATRAREQELERATRGRRGPPYELSTGEQKLHAHHRAREIYLSAIQRQRDDFDPRALRESAIRLRKAARELRGIRSHSVKEWVDNLLRQARNEDIRAKALAAHYATNPRTH